MNSRCTPASRLGIWAVVAAELCACGGAVPAETKRPRELPAPKATVVQPTLPKGPLSVVFGPQAGLSLRLPVPGKWRAEDSVRWLTFTHDASKSRLSLRSWRAERRVRPQQCEAQARLWRHELPPLPADNVVDERALSSPPGYVAQLTVLVQQADASSPVEGWALVFGASIGKCYAAIFETRAHGAGAGEAIAERLAIIADGVLPSVQEQGVDDRILGPR